MRRCTQFEVLANGDTFYEAMLDGIRRAERSVNLECYIFQRGEVAKITLREWSKRPVFEHAHEMVGWIFERQQ
jgi:phosphatidylserine/phosphatidylglycerophosphate/cardiolipin synthase-like enzyme